MTTYEPKRYDKVVDRTKYRLGSYCCEQFMLHVREFCEADFHEDGRFEGWRYGRTTKPEDDVLNRYEFCPFCGAVFADRDTGSTRLLWHPGGDARLSIRMSEDELQSMHDFMRRHDMDNLSEFVRNAVRWAIEGGME